MPHDSLLEEKDVQKCYDRFEEMFISLYELYFPEKQVKFNKNVHYKEKWMTKGLLKSRSTKLKLDEKSLKSWNQD